MDVFSHGLWAGAGAKAVNLKIKKPLRVWLAILFGVFPDVFAFAISFTYLNWIRITGGTSPFIVRPGEMEPPIRDQHPLLQLTHTLYKHQPQPVHFFHNIRNRCLVFPPARFAESRRAGLGNGRMAFAYFDGHPIALIRIFPDTFSLAIFFFQDKWNSVVNTGIFLHECCAYHHDLYFALGFGEKEKIKNEEP